MKVVLPLPPSANRYWRNFHGRMVKSADARQYKETVGWLLKEAGVGEIMTGPVGVSIEVYRERKTGDLDNRIKVLLDALNGIVWQDDDQVVAIHAYRFDDKDNPRAVVDVVPYLPGDE